jgi:pimeloyl-ACP methyl ester carboxylesterase
MTLRRRVVDLDGPVHYLDSEGEGPPVVLVHGLGGASINWLTAARYLRSRRRVLALDLVGFGLTPPLDRAVGVAAQRRVLDQFIRKVAAQPVLLMGNSMGGLISILQAAEAPSTVAGLVLVNPAAQLDLWGVRDPRVLSLGLFAIPGMGDYLARTITRGDGAEAFVTHFFSLVCHRPEGLDPELLAAHVALAKLRSAMPWAAPVFSRAVRSTLAKAHSRSLGRAVAAVRAPTLIIHGRHDRLVSLAAARKLARCRPDWSFEVLEDIGHVPQIECPEQFVRIVDAWSTEARLLAS